MALSPGSGLGTYDVLALICSGDVHTAIVPRQYCGRAKIIDVGLADRHSTGDARRLPDLRCGPISLVDT